VLNALRKDDTGWDAATTYTLNRNSGKDNIKVLEMYDAYVAIQTELKKFKPTDIHRENVGRKMDGTIAAFDLRTER
jgi:hypothetical protein